MNKQAHRLVFDRRRGMRVPAAEHVKSVGKAAGGESRGRAVRAVAAACAASTLAVPGAGLLPAALLTASGLGAIAAPQVAEAQSQPVRRSLRQALPRSAGRTVRNLPVLSTDAARTQYNRGAFSVLNPSSSLLQINQADQRVVINWDSFDIGRGYTVRFVQPDKGSALNNIWANDPSVILGNLEANGEVILQNQNGVIFGPTARVQTQRFVTTALKLAEETFMKGIRSDVKGDMVFGSDDQSRHGFINIERGAEIKALAGGDVIMVAPRVYNEGRIETPSGQTVLAAGQKVYLTSSVDQAQRGLIVAVDSFVPAEGDPEDLGTVEQAQAATYKTLNGQTVEDDTPDGTPGLVKKINQVVADKGRINLVGLTVRQNGNLSATTAVKGENGAIYLHAMKNSQAVDRYNGPVKTKARIGQELGTLELGDGSITSVTPSASTATQKDAETFYRSMVDGQGRDIRIHGGAVVEATSGSIAFRATKELGSNGFGDRSFTQLTPNPDGSHLIIDSGARLTAAGVRNVKLPMSRNQLSLTLFQNELADSPVQRGGPVYRSPVFFDARKDIKLANVKGAYAAIERTAMERSTRGGSITLQSTGTTVVSDGATLDVSGGSKVYGPGQVFSSSLSRQRGGVVGLEDADPRTRYDRLINPIGPGEDASSLSRRVQLTEPGYVEGDSAGLIQVQGSQVYLGGEIKADAVVGPRQRFETVASKYMEGLPYTHDGLLQGMDRQLAAEPHTYASLRPLSGALLLTAGGQIALSAAGGPAHEPVPTLGTEAADAWAAQLGNKVTLSSTKLQQVGLGELSLNGFQVKVNSEASLNLGASGIFTANGESHPSVSDSGHVEVQGRIKAEGGRVALSGQHVGLTSTAVVDLAGRTADERRDAAIDGVSVNGGKFSASASGTGSVVLQPGAQVDVSAGLWTSGAGKSTTGKAGAITLEANGGGGAGALANSAYSGELQFEGALLRGYGFNGGGALDIKGMRSLWIGNEVRPTGEIWDQGVRLSAGFFNQGGFSNFSLSALGNVEVEAGTVIRPEVSSLVVAAPSTRSGNAPRSTALAVLQEGLRSPVSITLSATLQPDFTPGAPREPSLDALMLGGSLTVGQGALIDVGVNGSLALRAGRNLDVWGALVARAGTVSLNILGKRGGGDASNPGDKVGYLSDQFLRLHSGSRIDVSGAAKTWTDARGRTVGEVLGGGTVNLNVKSVAKEGESSGAPVRGIVVAERGSVIDASGVAAPVHMGSSREPTMLSAGAGTVNVEAAEGFALQGTLKATRPDDSVAGGTFSATLRANAFPYVVPGATPFPTAERELLLLASSQDVQAHQRADSQGVVSAQQLLDGGFDRISLASDHHVTLAQGADLMAPSHAARGALQSVVIDTPVLRGTAGATHRIQSTYASLGDRSHSPNDNGGKPALNAVSGSAQLQVDAGLVEVFGDSALQGFKKVALNATLSADHQPGRRRDGEIRFIGRNVSAGKEIKGSLAFTEQLTLTAGQVYATTLSQFQLTGAGASTLTVEAPKDGSTSAAPWSALAQLKLTAQDINLNGVIRQPFGSIAVEASREVRLGASSLLSVSGEGATVPVGLMASGGRQWLYVADGDEGVLNPAQNKSITELDKLVLDKTVTVKAPSPLIDPSSRIEAQAGGDLQAWEFVPGVGGSTDTLKRDGVFAIVPNYRYDFAPYDTQVAAASATNGLKVGDQVRIDTANGALAAGTYTLLPARYALMPGAVLVSAAQLPSPQPLARGITFDDGSMVVSGQLTGVGTAWRAGNDPRVGLLLEPEATFRAKSAFNVSSINGYKAQTAQRRGEPVPARPGDGGIVRLSSSNTNPEESQFNWAARYNLKGGQLDLDMAGAIAIVDGQAAPTGYAAISAKALMDTQADSILVGGSRALQSAAVQDGVKGAATPETALTTSASKVLVNASINEKVGELVLLAKTEVKVADGVTLASGQADTDTEHTYRLGGEGAALLVGHNAGAQVQRQLTSSTAPASDKGQLVISKGVALAGGNVQLDASGLAKVHVPAPGTSANDAKKEDVKVTARTLGLGVPSLALGSGTAPEGSLVLQGGLLTSASEAQRVVLRSYKGIDIVGDTVSFGGAATRQLVLDGPSIRSQGGHATFEAHEVVLRNTTGQTSQAAGGAGTLTVRAFSQPDQGRTGGLTIGQGQQHLAFNEVQLTTRGDAVFDNAGTAGDNGLTTQGNVTISAARVTAAGATRHALTSGGVLTVNTAANARSLGEVVGSGATLDLKGQRVVQDGTIELLSGRLNITGTGQEVTTVNAAGASETSLVPQTVVFGEGSKTLTKGWTAQAGETWAVSSQGGDITATAERGQIVVLGELDVSAPAAASTSDTAKSAGKITLAAAGASGQVLLGQQARLKGAAATDSLSGRLVVDTRELIDHNPGTTQAGGANAGVLALDRLATQARAGGLHGGVDLRLREGSYSLDTTMKAVRTSISIDQGSLTLRDQAVIDARAPQGGLVQLSARDNVTMEQGAGQSASILANSTREGANGGDVLLNSVNGRIVLGEGTEISAGGDGRIVMRFDGETEHSDGPRISAAGSRLTAGQVIAEGVLVRQADAIAAEASAGTLSQDELMAAARSFTDNNAGLLSTFGLGEVQNAQLRAGLEIRSVGDLTVEGDWNLQAQRDAVGGGAPIMLTLRAGNHLLLKGSISDGFGSAAGEVDRTPDTPTEILSGSASSYRLVAGADTEAAGLLKTRQGMEGQGNLVIAPEKIVRTTDGSIEMAAAGDIELQRDGAKGIQAVVYIAGRRVDVEQTPQPLAQYTAHGGRLEAVAGGDVKAPPGSQMFGHWLYHVGAEGPTSVGWWSALDSFRQGFGSFGGGNVWVEAAKNVANLGVVSPTSAHYVPAGESAPAGLKIDNGGDVTVHAGEDVKGGMFLLGRGKGLVKAMGSVALGDEIVAVSAVNPRQSAKLFPGLTLGLMDGQWAVESTGDVNLALVYNPTILSSPERLGGLASAEAGRYFTYTPDSALSAASAGGSVNWSTKGFIGTFFEYMHNNNNIADELERIRTHTSTDSSISSVLRDLNKQMARVAPPRVQLASLGGSVALESGGMTNYRDQWLFPSAVGDLSIYAKQDLTLLDGHLAMGDGNPARWPTPAAPVAESEFKQDNRENVVALMVNPFFPLSSTLHQQDKRPARLYAGRDIDFKAGTGLTVPKAASVVAGRDLLSPNFRGQHFSQTDVTVLKAGNNVLGSLDSATGAIQLMGPGELHVEAGRLLDLRNSLGIQTLGNRPPTDIAGLQLRDGNAALPDESARIRLAAGMGKTVVLAEFVSAFLGSAEAQARFTTMVNEVLNPGAVAPAYSSAAYQQALSMFSALTSAQQVSIANDVINREFVAQYLASGRPYHQAWLNRAAVAGVAVDNYQSNAFARMKDEVVFAEIERLGDLAVDLADSTDALENARRKAQRDLWWAEAQTAISRAGLGRGFAFAGDIELAGSRVHTRGPGGFDKGGIDLFVPGGQIVVGLNQTTDRSGLITYKGGSIRSLSRDDFLVNRQKAIIVGEGDFTIYSATGAINTGTGSNTDVSAAVLTPVETPEGIEWETQPPTNGSGLAILSMPDASRAGNLRLFAPVKGILALDAFIRNESGGDIKVQGPVQGADNLKGNVKGAAAPVVRAGLKVGGNLPNEAAASAETSAQRTQSAQRRDPSSILTVELTGMGTEALQATGGGTAVRKDCDRDQNQDCAKQ